MDGGVGGGREGGRGWMGIYYGSGRFGIWERV